MTNYLIKKESLENIADAIRDKAGVAEKMTLDEMAEAINEIDCDQTGILIGRFIEEYNGIDVSKIRDYAFYSYAGLISANFPACSHIGYSAFYECGNLINMSFPICEKIEDYAFYYCYNLIDMSFPMCKKIGNYAFYCCSNISEVYSPECTHIGEHAFETCYNISNVNLSKCEHIGECAFQRCSNITEINMPSCSYIGSYAFRYCSSLMSLFLSGSSTIALTQASTFYGTPMSNSAYTGSFGSIYVPASLVSLYKSATNWVEYADRIISADGVGISEIKNAMILFNQSSQISVDVFRRGACMNSDIIATITSSDESIVSIYDINVSNESITFKLNAHQIEDVTTIYINVYCGDFSCASSFNVDVREKMPDPTWRVETISGADYGFELNSNGYYESENKGIHNSAAVCKLKFDTQGTHALYIDYINFAENHYDYGYISNLDTELSTSNTVDDSSMILKNFYNYNSSVAQTVEIGAVPAGEHFVYIKFRKDVSYSQNNDTLQFKVRMEPL